MKIKFMVFILVAFGFLPELVILSVSCAPKALSQGTIEVDNAFVCNTNSTNYPVNVSLDGGNTQGVNQYNALPGVSGGQLYTFPNTVSPGYHTLTFSIYNPSTVSGCSGTNWYYQPGPGATGGGTIGASCSLTFNVNGGQIYDAYATIGSACNAISITHM